MTVSYKKSRGGSAGGAGAADYYVKSGMGADDYYTAGEKEPPGRWYVGPTKDGQRSSDFGINHAQEFSVDDSESFKTLADGFHPDSGLALTQNSGSDKRVAIHDFTASAPKSVSVVWSQAPHDMKQQIEEIQLRSAEAMLDLFSSKAISRQGKAGVEKSEAMLRGALFSHGSSRENDPQLHTHAVMFNVAERLDMSTGALETKEMMRWQGAAASIYHSELAYNLRQIGFEIKKDGNLFEVEGISSEVNDAFSQRRKQIEEKVRADQIAMGIDPDSSSTSRGLYQIAALDTRVEKSDLSRDELISLWEKRGKELGFSKEEVLALKDSKEIKFLNKEEREKSIENSVDEILKTKSIFSEPELITKATVSMMGLASREEILKSIEDYKVNLLISENDKGHSVFTTKEMLAIEQDMLDCANRNDGSHAQENFNLPDSLSTEQREAAIGSLTDKNAVTIVEGTAGAGKTFTMASVARAYEQNGYEVIGLSSSWTAALNLKKDANLAEGHAITGWVGKQSGNPTIGPKSLLIVDESGTVGTEQMRDVLKIAKDQGAKVVLLGDTKQQKSVGAGDAFGKLSSELGSHRLDEIRRQFNLEERTAIKQLFDGESHEALKTFKNNGNLSISENNETLEKKLIDDWQASRSRGVGSEVSLNRDGERFNAKITASNEKTWVVQDSKNREFEIEKSHIILATDNSSVNRLNQLAHEARKQNNEIKEGAKFETMSGEVEFSVGDEVQFRKNKLNLGISNRSRGVITGIDGDTLHVKLEANENIVKIDTKSDDWMHEESGSLAMQHGYATTVYSSQGLTVGYSFLKDGNNLARDSAGVAMSRHREEAHIYADRSANYESSVSRLASNDWFSKNEFTDEKVFDSVASRWQRENKKSSALDFEWKNSDGAKINKEFVSVVNRTKIVKDTSKNVSLKVSSTKSQEAAEAAQQIKHRLQGLSKLAVENRKRTDLGL